MYTVALFRATVEHDNPVLIYANSQFHTLQPDKRQSCGNPEENGSASSNIPTHDAWTSITTESYETVLGMVSHFCLFCSQNIV